METLNWTYILYLLVGIPATINLFIIAQKDRLLSILLFGLALLSFVLGILIDYIVEGGMSLAREWGDLVAITFTLCGLFVKIRNSKPIFARFPLYLTMLPLLVIVFYPLIVDSNVVKELLQITYQGGAIIVSLLVVSINHFLYRQRSFLLISCLVFLLAFSSHWFLGESFGIVFEDLAKILFSIGIIIASIGFKKISDLRTNQMLYNNVP